MKQPWIQTPLVESAPLSKAAGCRIFLKLENVQPSGSFKIRGIGNYILKRLEESRGNDNLDSSSRPHFYSSSGGNAGLACVTAATSLGYAATVVVPIITKPMMIAKIKAAGAAEVVQQGANWKAADTYLREVLLKNDPSGIYVPPFDHPDIWEGHSTLMHEMQRQLEYMEASELTNGHAAEASKPDAIICSVGGGGLFCGIMQGAQQIGWADVPVVAVETEGAASFHASRAAGELVTIPKISTIATTLGATRVAEQAFEYGRQSNVRNVVLSDAEAAMGCWRLADDERMMVEPACGVNAALCYDGRLEKVLGDKFHSKSKVVIVLCGGVGVTVDMLTSWRKEYGYIEQQLPANGEVPSTITAP